MTVGSPASSSPRYAASPLNQFLAPTVSTTLKEPTAISAPAESLQGVKLSEHIRYLHCHGGDEGGHGVLIFTNPNGSVTTADVETQDEFRAEFSAFCALESAFYGR